MSSHTDTAGHTKVFIYPAMDHWGWGGGVVLRYKANSKCSGTRQIRNADGVVDYGSPMEGPFLFLLLIMAPFLFVLLIMAVLWKDSFCLCC